MSLMEPSAVSQDTAALIRKATLAAHEALATLDGTLQEQIAELYAEAIEAIADQIMQAAAHGELGRIEALRGMMDYAVARLRAMQDAYGQLLDSALMEAARLGTEPYASAAVAGLNTAAVAAEAALFVKTFQAADGLQLSDRLWRLDAQASETMQNLLREAVLTGRDHERLAADILRDLHDRMTGPGSPLDNALRLARTEINRAHGEAYMMGGEKGEGFAGWRFLLSPAHPRPDICDLHARANLYGLGPGVYPDRARCPWPAHPNTLSYVEIVFEDEIDEADRKGKTDPITWLKTQPRDVQEAVLGKHKADWLAEGKLKAADITTPWKELKDRED